MSVEITYDTDYEKKPHAALIMKDWGIRNILNYEFDRKACLSERWDDDFVSKILLEGCLRGRVRGDKDGKYWIIDPSSPSGWEKISEQQLEGVRFMADGIFYMVKHPLHMGRDYCDRSRDLPAISAQNWFCKDHFVDRFVVLKDIIDFARKEHERLPPFRGSDKTGLKKT